MWFEDGRFEPDYRSINIMNELCWSDNPRLIKFLAFDVVAHLDLHKISESYFRKQEIMPQQINDLLKCWLQLLADFGLRDSIRESAQFSTLLRPVFNQAEILQCWSMLSDTAYADVVLNKFATLADHTYALSSRGTDKGLLLNLFKASAEFYALAERNMLSCFSSAKRRCYLKAICQILLKPTVQTVTKDIETFQSCIMNLLTDIETFSIYSTTEDTSSKCLKHEIQLLIDECLSLISSEQNPELAKVYLGMFESWLGSSKDSPILVHFINRLSKHVTTTSHRLLELCIEVFFQTEHADTSCLLDTSNDAKLFPNIDSLKHKDKVPAGWQTIMDNVEFKLNFSGYEYSTLTRIIANPKVALFEFVFLDDSSFLLLYAYMLQRLAMFKATYTDKSNQFVDVMLNYTSQVLSRFENTYKSGHTTSHPKPGGEEKFCLVLKFLFEVYLLILTNTDDAVPMQAAVGEQLARISNLLIFYGEDVMSNQNPMNDSQSLGSDLLSSIGLNILAKKSLFSIEFRAYCRCLANCLLKKVKLVNGVYRINEEADSMASGLATASTEQLMFGQLCKQAAYQYHLIFQIKTYSNMHELTKLNALMCEYLERPTPSAHFSLTHIDELSTSLCKQLFQEKHFFY